LGKKFEVSLREIFQQALAGAFGQFLGDAMGWFAVLVVLILGSIPVYFLMRRFGWGPRPGAIPFDTSWEAARAREHLADQLDQAESGLIGFYRYFLYLLILLVTGFGIFLLRQLGKDPNQMSMKLYLGIGYLMFLGWVACELWRLRWRRYAMDWSRAGRPPVRQAGAVAGAIIGSILAIGAVGSMILWFRK
jgi:hypothetical protein